MTGWLALGGVLLAGFAFLSLVFAFFLLMLKAVFWLVLLPLRLLGWAFGAVLMVVVTAFAIVIGLLAILAPFIPLAIVGGLIYGVYRLVRRTPAAPVRGF